MEKTLADYVLSEDEKTKVWISSVESFKVRLDPSLHCFSPMKGYVEPSLDHPRLSVVFYNRFWNYTRANFDNCAWKKWLFRFGGIDLLFSGDRAIFS